jgi:hypothetical protein
VPISVVERIRVRTFDLSEALVAASSSISTALLARAADGRSFLATLRPPNRAV